MKKETVYLIVIILTVMIGGTIFYFGGKESIRLKKESFRENLVDCLTAKNIKIYISTDCPPCQRQREIFGNSFSKINYIECLEEKTWSKICLGKGINTVPTWSFPINLEIEEKLLSCIECIEKSEGTTCKDYCYEVSQDRQALYVTGFVELEKLSEVSGCSLE